VSQLTQKIHIDTKVIKRDLKVIISHPKTHSRTNCQNEHPCYKRRRGTEAIMREKWLQSSQSMWHHSSTVRFKRSSTLICRSNLSELVSLFSFRFCLIVGGTLILLQTTTITTTASTTRFFTSFIWMSATKKALWKEKKSFLCISGFCCFVWVGRNCFS